jgi:hypothetical protein
VHSAATPPLDVSPAGQAVQSSVFVAPVLSEYVSFAQVLSEHAVIFPPAENVPFAQAVHPSSKALAPFAILVYCPAGHL